nr:MAG TPA: RK RWP-RK domain [Caudoviricetes sp.]
MTAKKASEEIGINPITYRKIRNGGEVKPIIYQKVMEWFAEDY